MPNYNIFDDPTPDEMLRAAGRSLGVGSIVESEYGCNSYIQDWCIHHAQYQASHRRQGHQNWDYRRTQLAERLPRFRFEEVCAESWNWNTRDEAAVEMFNSWRQSPGHWQLVTAPNKWYGYSMAKGSNGIWYACGIFAFAR